VTFTFWSAGWRTGGAADKFIFRQVLLLFCAARLQFSVAHREVVGVCGKVGLWGVKAGQGDLLETVGVQRSGAQSCLVTEQLERVQAGGGLDVLLVPITQDWWSSFCRQR